MKKIRIDYFGFEGEGKTLKEAKASAARKVQALIRDVEIGPRIIKLDTIYAVIGRLTFGWQYQLIMDDGSIGSTHTGLDDEGGKETENKARVHAAQILCKIPDSPRFDLILNEHDRKDHQSWFSWQCRYRAARDSGYDDGTARNIANGLDHLIEKKDLISV